MELGADIQCDVAVRKRKAEPFLSQESGHPETLEWLTSFLDNDCYKAAIHQLEKANAGRIDGEVLFSIAEKEELRTEFGLDATISRKIWMKLQELKTQQCAASILDIFERTQKQPGQSQQGNDETQAAIESDVFAAAVAAAAAAAAEAAAKSPSQVSALPVPVQASPVPAVDEADAAPGDMEEDPASEEEEPEEEEEDDPEFAPTAEDMSCDGDDDGNDASEDDDLRMDPNAIAPVSAEVTTRSGRATRLSTRAMASKGLSPAPTMTTRARASSQVPVPTDMETDHEATDDEEQEAEDEMDADQCLLKPAKQSLFLQSKQVPPAVPVQEGSGEEQTVAASANALVDYDMRYNHNAKGLPGLEQLLLVLNRNELAAVVQVLGLNSDQWLNKVGRKKNKHTGEWSPITRKRPDKELRSKLLRDGLSMHSHSEPSLRSFLKRLSENELVAEGMRRYLDHYFTIHPPILEDGSNLANALMTMWASSVDSKVSKIFSLGTKELTFTQHHVKEKKGVAKKGRLQQLVHHIEEGDITFHHIKQGKNIKLGERNKEQKKADADQLDWLKNAAKATEGNIMGHYEMFNVKGGTKTKCLLRFTLKSQEAFGGHGDLTDLLDGLDEYSNEHVLMDHIGEMQDAYHAKARALAESGISELPRGEEGAVSLGELEDMFEIQEKKTFQDPLEGTKMFLDKKLKLKLKNYQLHALYHHLEEEQNSGTSRHLWVELPVVLNQPYYVPGDEDDEDDLSDEAVHERFQRLYGGPEEDRAAKKARQAQSRAARAQRRTGTLEAGEVEDDDNDDDEPEEEIEDSEVEDCQNGDGDEMAEAGPSSGVPTKRNKNPSKGTTPAKRQKPASKRLPSVASILAQGNGHIPEGAVAPKGIRLFFSPVLNAFVWGPSLRKLQQEGRQLAVSAMRGGFLWLEMGMGKTAVMIALMSMPTPAAWAPELEVPEAWDDAHLYDGDLGYAPRVMHKAQTLVIVCNTLVDQWEREIRKFTGGKLSVKVFYGKSKNMLPSELGEYDVVIAAPDGLSSQKTLQAVHWHRIIVDEAHQQPGLMQTLALFPAMAKYCVTGTPYNEKATDISKMMGILGLPSFSYLSKNNHQLGYLLEKVAVRYTAMGELDGQINMQLPPKTEIEKLVSWNARDVRKFARLEEKIRDDLEIYLDKVDRKRQEKEEIDRLFITNHMSVDEYTVQNYRVTNNYLLPLRQACSGGIPVMIPASNDSEETDDEGGDPEDEDDEPLEPGSWIFSSKVEALIKEVKRIIDSDRGAKILIFSAFQNTLSYVRKVMTRHGFKFRTIDSGMTMCKKGEALEAFQTDPPTTIFLLNANVATVGLNLTAANNIILLEPSLNPAQERQAVGRAHRMGQQRPVTVLRLIMKDTVEVKIRELIKRRQEAGRIKELDAPANGAVPVVVKKKGGGRGKRQAGAPPPAPRGAGKKAARDKANDTAGLDRAGAVEELCGLMKLERLNRRLEDSLAKVKVEKTEDSPSSRGWR